MIMSSRSIPISIVSKVQSQDIVKSVSRCSNFLRSQKCFFFFTCYQSIKHKPSRSFSIAQIFFRHKNIFFDENECDPGN